MTTATLTNTARTRTVIAVTPAVGDQPGSWIRLVRAVDPAKKGAFALDGGSLAADTAYEFPPGATVIACRRTEDGRTISMLRAEDGGLEEVHTWQQKSPLGARIVAYVARRLAPDAAHHRAVRQEAVPNRYPGWCASCRRRVETLTGLVDPSGTVRHPPGQCPPPPQTITPNRYSGPCHTCGMWVDAGDGIAVRLEAQDPDTESWYQQAHAGPCPPDALPGPGNAWPGWCAICLNHLDAGEGYWHPGGRRIVHIGECPPSQPGQTWIVRVQPGMGRWRRGETVWVEKSLRIGDPFPDGAPGLQVLGERYVRFVADVVDVVAGGSGRQTALVRAATVDRAASLLADRLCRALEVVPPRTAFRARMTLAVPEISGQRLRVILSDIGTLRPWIAEITGRDPVYRWNRVFMRGDVDWRTADKHGRVREKSWTLRTGRVYEARWLEGKSLRQVRTYLRVTDDGDIIEITAEEVHAWLDATWALLGA